MSAPVVAFDLEDVVGNVGLGQRFGRLSIVDRFTSEPLQAITNRDPVYVKALLGQWNLAIDHARRKVEDLR